METVFQTVIRPKILADVHKKYVLSLSTIFYLEFSKAWSTCILVNSSIAISSPLTYSWIQIVWLNWLTSGSLARCRQQAMVLEKLSWPSTLPPDGTGLLKFCWVPHAIQKQLTCGQLGAFWGKCTWGRRYFLGLPRSTKLKGSSSSQANQVERIFSPCNLWWL